VSSKRDESSVDRLGLARAALLLLWGLAGLALVIVLIGGAARELSEDPRPAFVRALSLSTLGLEPTPSRMSAPIFPARGRAP
jgi:hypothetical protein